MTTSATHTCPYHPCPICYPNLAPYNTFNSRNPYVCPKCFGQGTEDGSKADLGSTKSKCFPCNGTGIVWG